MASISQKENQRKFANKTISKIKTNEALHYLMRCFRLVGVLFTDENKYVYYLYVTVIHLSIAVFLPVSFVASYFTESNKDIEIDTFLTSVQVAINAIGSSIKISMLFYYVPHLLKAEPIMAKLDERCKDEREFAFLYELRKICKRFVVGTLTLFWTYATFTLIAGLLSGHPSYSLYLPFINWRNSKWELGVASFIEWLLMLGACAQEVANDTYAPIYVSMLRAHVNMLRLRIRELCANREKSLEYNVEELKRCIKDHNKIIELYNIISPVISATIFLQFNITAGVIGITLINITIFAKTFSAKLASAFFVVSVVVETFPLCYYANCLMQDSDRLCDEIFHSSWFEQKAEYRKIMIFFMQRTQVTIEFLAGKMILINLNSFISIAKLSLSVYTLVKNMNMKQKEA